VPMRNSLCPPPCHPLVHADGDVIGRQAFQVVAQLGVQLTFDVVASPEAPPPTHAVSFFNGAPPLGVKR
jgi:hypothetical protein